MLFLLRGALSPIVRKEVVRSHRSGDEKPLRLSELLGLVLLRPAFLSHGSLSQCGFKLSGRPEARRWIGVLEGAAGDC